MVSYNDQDSEVNSKICFHLLLETSKAIVSNILLIEDRMSLKWW